MKKKQEASRGVPGVSTRVESGEIDPEQTRVLLGRFVEEFVEPARREALSMLLRRSPAKQRPIDYERVLRSDRTVDATADANLLRWLSAEGRHPYCYFLQRDARRPATRMRIATLNESLATSWPGVFVNFDAGRAIAVTPDMQRVKCDVR